MHLARCTFGFRKYHSTDTASCYLLENIKCKIDSGVVVGVVFIDLTKAFDTINHQTLLKKLSSFNLSKNKLNWLESYLSQRRQCVPKMCPSNIVCQMYADDANVCR